MAEVTLTGIRKTFYDAAGRPVPVLRGIDLCVASGECFTLLGPSGCGKTTLLRIIAGLERPDAGTVRIDGHDVTALPPERRPTAMVFQNYALFPHLTVAGNVAFGLRLPRPRGRRLAAGAIRAKVEALLDLVQLEGLGGRRIGELSGGQQQRVALARVLAVEPSILLLDEPLSNLDASLRRVTRAAIRRLQTELGLTAIYITHDQEEGLAISDRLALMSEGCILQAGTPRALCERPATVEAARFLGQRNLIAAVVAAVDVDGYRLTPARPGPRLERGSDASVAGGARNIIRVAGADANIGGGALRPGDPVWLAVRPGEIMIEAIRPGDRDGGSGEEAWRGEVDMSAWTGEQYEVELRLHIPGGATDEAVRVRALCGAATGDALIRGANVRVRLRPGAGMIYPRTAMETQ